VVATLGARTSARATRRGIEPLAVLWRRLGRRIALREQLVEGEAAAPLRHGEASSHWRFSGAGAQVQKVENNGRNGQHDRAADLAQIRGVHCDPHLAF
jgi:hypothetical protein